MISTIGTIMKFLKIDKIKMQMWPSMVAHICNFRYLGVTDRRILV
jgi:hypothetical protein